MSLVFVDGGLKAIASILVSSLPLLLNQGHLGGQRAHHFPQAEPRSETHSFHLPQVVRSSIEQCVSPANGKRPKWAKQHLVESALFFGNGAKNCKLELQKSHKLQILELFLKLSEMCNVFEPKGMSGTCQLGMLVRPTAHGNS